MEKITLNGIRYIGLGEFDRLRRGMVQDIYAKYEKGEDGHIHLSPEDMARVDALTHLMVEIMHEELSDCGPDREKRDRVYAELRSEALKRKWCIVTKDGPDDKPAYFRMWCDQAKEDEETPVFSTLKRDAKLFSDHFAAQMTYDHIKAQCPEMEHIDIMPASYLSGDAEKRLLDAIFGDNDMGEWVIFLEPMNGDEGMWFNKWLKYRDDLPDEIKEMCEKSGMKPGESRPVFADENGGCMIFAHKGMAEKQVEKITEMYPDWKGKLHVMAYEDVSE